jgi:hypothetical protein
MSMINSAVADQSMSIGPGSAATVPLEGYFRSPSLDAPSRRILAVH